MKRKLCSGWLALGLLAATPSLVQAQFAAGVPLRPDQKVSDSPMLAGAGAVPRLATAHSRSQPLTSILGWGLPISGKPIH